MLIRQIQREDAEQLLRLQLQLDKETKFMLHEHGERKTTVEEQRQHIEVMIARGGMIFVAEHEAGLSATSARQPTHSGVFVIA